MDLEPLIVKAELHAGSFFTTLRQMEQALVQTGRASDAATRNVAGNFRGLGAAVRSPLAAITSFRGAVVGLGSALGATQVIKYAEAYTIVQNQLRVAGVETNNLAAATEEIFAIATKTRAPVESMAEVFSRVATAGGELGISMREAFQFTELVGKSVAIAGASSAAASGALTQLAQAMGGAVVQAQEFNSIVDGARPLLVAAARGIDEAGGSVARLRTLVLQGQLSAKEFFDGIMAGSEAIIGPFERAVVRPSQAMQVLRTAVIQTIGEMDQASSGTAALAGAINDLAASIRSPEFQAFAQDVVAGIGTTIHELHSGVVAIIPVIRELASGLDAMTDVDLGELDLLKNTLREIEAIKQFSSRVAGSDVAGALEGITRSNDLLERQAQIEQDIATTVERRDAAQASLNADVQSMIEQLDEARAKQDAMDEAGATRAGEQQAIVQQLIAEIEQRQLASTQITIQEERLAQLRQEEAEVLRLIQAQNAERARLPDLMTEKDLGVRFGPLFGAEKIPGGGAPGGAPDAGTKRATFEDIIGPLRTRLELLQQTELTEDRIGEIISAQGRLKRDLTTVEREALNSINAAVDAEEEIREKAEERKTAGEDLVESMRDQQEQAQLLVQFGGQETTEYQRQLALLEAQQEVSGELTAEERRRVLVAQQATAQAEQQVRMLDLRKRTQEADFASSQALEAGISDITGLPPRQSFFAQQERFRLQMEGRTAEEIQGLEPLIQDMARAQQHLQLMTDTAPRLARTLTELSQIAISEGFEEAGTRFLEMLSEMILEALILQSIMAAIGLISGKGSFGTPMATTPGGVPIHGVRQHGGPVSANKPYLVGEAGPELFVPNTSGNVLSGSRTTGGAGGGGGGGGGITVNVINNAPNAQVETQQDEKSGRIDVMIDEMTAGNLRPGTATSRALRERFGLKYSTRS